MSFIRKLEKKRREKKPKKKKEKKETKKEFEEKIYKSFGAEGVKKDFSKKQIDAIENLVRFIFTMEKYFFLLGEKTLDDSVFDFYKQLREKCKVDESMKILPVDVVAIQDEVFEIWEGTS